MIKLFSYLSIYYYRGQRYKLILNLQTLSKFLCFQLLIIAQDDVGGGSSFLSSLKETKQRKVQKRPELRGRNTNSSNHSMNSLRSNSISYFVPQIAFRNQRLNIDSKNLHSSKDLFVRNVFEELRDDKTWSTKCGNREALATNRTQECF